MRQDRWSSVGAGSWSGFRSGTRVHGSGSSGGIHGSAVCLVADHERGGTAATGKPFTGRDMGCLRLARSIFGISDI